MREEMREGESGGRGSRFHSALWGAGGAAGITLGQLLQGVILIPVYLTYMSLGDYGVWLASGNVITWLALVDPGFGEIARIRIAFALGTRDLNRASAVAAAAFSYAAGAVLLFWIVGLGISVALPVLLPVAASSRGSLQAALGLSVLGTGFVLFSYVVGDVLSAAQRQRVVALTTVAGLFLGIGVSVAVLLMTGNGLVALGAAPLVRGLLSLLVLTPKCWAALKREGVRRLRWDRTIAREFAKTGAAVFVARAGNAFSQTGDPLLIAWLVGAPEAALYSLGARARDLLQSVPARFTNAAVPALAHRIGEGRGPTPQLREGNARLALAISSLGVALAAGSMLGFVATNRAFVALWVGADKSPSLMMNVTIGLAGLALGVREALHTALLAYGEVRTVASQNIVETFVKVIAALLLVAMLGSLGAPLGALIATCAVLPRSFVLLRRAVAGHAGILRLVLVTVGSVALVGLVGALVARWIPLSIGMVVFMAAAGASAIVGLVVPLVASPEAREMLRAAVDRTRKGHRDSRDARRAGAPFPGLAGQAPMSHEEFRDRPSGREESK